MQRREPETLDVMERIHIPVSPEELGGDARTTEAVVLSERESGCIVEIACVPDEIEWLGDFEFVYAQRQHDGTLKAIRKATTEQIKQFRVPVWIQGEEIPECCGSLMHFVGQLDDNALCTEVPEGAKYWWHDAASFYVFTCANCLGVKAVGQQF